MYDNVKFKEKIGPFKESHKHGQEKPRFKLRSVTTTPQEDPPPSQEKDHVICLLCGEDLTYAQGGTTINLSEKYIPV